MPFPLTPKKRFLIVAMGVLSVVGYWLFWPWPLAESRGSLAARIDVAVGSYKVLAIGLPTPWRQEYTRLLQERYGIRTRKMADCIVSRSLVSYVTKYNDVSAAAAKEKFGRDPFQKCYEDAKRDWEQRRNRMALTPIAVPHH